MGGPDATPDLWKQPFSAVRASGGYPGNAHFSRVETQLDFGPGSEIGVGWKIGVKCSRKQSFKMVATELGYLLTKLSFWLSLLHDISISWHGSYISLVCFANNSRSRRDVTRSNPPCCSRVSSQLFIMFNLCACNVCENRRTITKISQFTWPSRGNIIFKFRNLFRTGLFDSAIWKVSDLHWIKI